MDAIIAERQKLFEAKTLTEKQQRDEEGVRGHEEAIQGEREVDSGGLWRRLARLLSVKGRR